MHKASSAISSHHSDEEILAAFSQDKELAFTWLLRRDQPKIYWFIRRMVIDHDDANDLVQEVFIKVWSNFHRFRAESSILHWIYRIAANHCITFLERKKKKHARILLDDVHDELKNKLHAGKLMEGDKIQIMVQEAILTLPTRQRLVFQLRYYDEIPFKEMSKILKTSEGALKASYHHAAGKIETYIKSKA